jgi:hypothetical protein
MSTGFGWRDAVPYQLNLPMFPARPSERKATLAEPADHVDDATAGADLSKPAQRLRETERRRTPTKGDNMNARKGNLATFVANRASGQTLAQSARAAGISVKTAQRRSAEPEVRAAIADAQADLTRHTFSRVRDLREVALDCLAEVLTSDEAAPASKLQAANIVLRHAAAADEAWVVDQVVDQAWDIAELQERMGPQDAPRQ